MTFYNRALPFKIHLKSSQDSPLLCEQLLRDLPGKRQVYRGLWRQRPVLVKLFLDSRSARRHWTREKQGVEALRNASVRTPQLLVSGQLTDHTFALVFEFLPHAQTALEVWDTLENQSCRLAFLQRLVPLVGRLHESGLVQKDLHLGNFLVSDQQLYAIDGDAICCRKSGKPLGLRASSKNLALFFAQLEPKHDTLIEVVYQHYAKQRNIPDLRLLHQLMFDLPKIRRRRLHKYVKKCYRNCSEFGRSHKNGQVSLYRRDVQGEALDRLVRDPDAFMRDGEILKAGNTCKVVRVKLDDCDWVIKRYNIKNSLHALSRYCRPTRAWTSWGNAHYLKISGIATPRAVAVIEKRFGPLRSTGYYVCDFQEGPLASDFFAAGDFNSPLLKDAAQNFVFLFELFRKLGIHHGDCKATNFLLVDNAPCVLDLDAMREPLSYENFNRLFQADRGRFLQNWQSQPDLHKWFDDQLPH